MSLIAADSEGLLQERCSAQFTAKAHPPTGLPAFPPAQCVPSCVRMNTLQPMIKWEVFCHIISGRRRPFDSQFVRGKHTVKCLMFYFKRVGIWPEGWLADSLAHGVRATEELTLGRFHRLPAAVLGSVSQLRGFLQRCRRPSHTRGGFACSCRVCGCSFSLKPRHGGIGEEGEALLIIYLKRVSIQWKRWASKQDNLKKIFESFSHQEQIFTYFSQRRNQMKYETTNSLYAGWQKIPFKNGFWNTWWDRSGEVSFF